MLCDWLLINDGNNSNNDNKDVRNNDMFIQISVLDNNLKIG